MQVSVEVLSGLEHRLTISIPAQEFEREVNQGLLKAKNTARLPGFRAGKVPLKEVRRRFGSSIRAEVAERMMKSSYGDAIVKQGLFPAGQPRLEVQGAVLGADLEFTAQFEVMPEVELADFSKIDVVRPQAEITEADVDQMVETLRRQRRTWRQVDRPVELGDRVQGDIKALLEGASAAREQEGFEFIVDEDGAKGSFDRALVGMRVGGAKVVDAPGSLEQPDGQLEPKAFDLTLRRVEEPVLPKLDDSFFSTMGVQEGGLAAFREEVASNMRRELNSRIKAQLKRQVLEGLLAQHEIPLPESLVHEEIRARKARMEAQMGRKGAKEGALPDGLFRAGAEKSVAGALIVRQIVRDHSLHPDDDRIRSEIEHIAESYAEPEAVARSIYRDESHLSAIEASVVEAMTVDVVLAQAKVKVLECSYEDVMSDRFMPGQPRQELAEAAAAGADQEQAV